MQTILKQKENEIKEMFYRGYFINVLFDDGEELTIAFECGQASVYSESGKEFDVLIFDDFEDALEMVDNYGRARQVSFEETSLYNII